MKHCGAGVLECIGVSSLLRRDHRNAENEPGSRCDELLELVGLGDETLRIKGFSRGMEQRLGIAQALPSSGVRSEYIRKLPY